MKQLKYGLLSTVLAATLAPAEAALAGWDEGVAAFTSKNFQSAEREFAQVVREDPRGWMGHYYLGLSLAALERKEESLSHLRKAYDLNPNELSVHEALGQAYNDQGKHADAELVLRKAQQKIWRQLGYAYEKQKKYPAAIDAYKQAEDTEGVERVRQLSRKRLMVKPSRNDTN